MADDAESAASHAEPRLDLWISDGKLYSIAADIALNVYVYVVEHDDAGAVSDVLRFRSGGEFDVRDITEARAKIDGGDFSR